MRTKTGYLFMDTLKKKFTKRALSTDEQIEMLSARGLIIPDRAIALQCLSTVSYYRLSAYLKPFQIHSENDHYFKPNITFDRIWKIYVFDRELRLHISDALERIEIALRTALSDVLMGYAQISENSFSHIIITATMTQSTHPAGC